MISIMRNKNTVLSTVLLKSDGFHTPNGLMRGQACAAKLMTATISPMTREATRARWSARC